MKKMFRFERLGRARRGFVLIELIIAVAIVAALSAVAVPSVISINNSLKSRQADDYAQSIYMSAQTTLTSSRIAGAVELSADKLTDTDNKARNILNAKGEATRFWYVTSDDQTGLYDQLMPAGSIDAALRTQQVIIKYNPKTQEICSVFYRDEPAGSTPTLYATLETLFDTTTGHIVLAASDLRSAHIGHYGTDVDQDGNILWDGGDGSDDPGDDPEEKKDLDWNLNGSDSQYLSYSNGTDGTDSGSRDGVLTVTIPRPTDLDMRDFQQNLEFDLTLKSGSHSDEVSIKAKLSDDSTTGSAVYTVTLDSADSLFGNVYSGFTAGEDVTATLRITGIAETESTKEAVANKTFTCTFNPLFAEPIGNTGTIKLANARNLQNLNNCADSIKSGVTTVQLSGDVTWYDNKDFTPLDLDSEKWDTLTLIEGDSHTISNISFPKKTTGQLKSIGLVSELKIAVQNLNLDNVSFTPDNAAAKIVGTIAGEATSTASIKNCAVTNIALTPKNLSTGDSIGGLVGISDGATIEDCTVTGTITGSDKDAYVGGAIGNDAGAGTYKNITADVALVGWGGTVGTASAGDPSGLGKNVGKFVGHVTGGAFTNCASDDADSDRNYQFLGKIDTSTVTAPTVSGTCYQLVMRASDESNNNIGAIDTLLKTPIKNIKLSEALTKFNSDSDKLNNAAPQLEELTGGAAYTASLSGCTFYNGSTKYEQYIDGDNHYIYQLKGTTIGTVPVNPFTDGAGSVNVFDKTQINDYSAFYEVYKGNTSANYGNKFPDFATPVFVYDVDNNALLHHAEYNGKNQRDTKGTLLTSTSAADTTVALSDIETSAEVTNGNNKRAYLWDLFHNSDSSAVPKDQFHLYDDEGIFLTAYSFSTWNWTTGVPCYRGADSTEGYIQFKSVTSGDQTYYNITANSGKYILCAVKSGSSITYQWKTSGTAAKFSVLKGTDADLLRSFISGSSSSSGGGETVTSFDANTNYDFYLDRISNYSTGLCTAKPTT